MFETTLDPDTTPQWFIDFYLSFINELKDNKQRLIDAGVAFIKEPLNEGIIKGAAIYFPERREIMMIAKKITDAYPPKIENFYYTTEFNVEG